jgi:hypothetical protein
MVRSSVTRLVDPRGRKSGEASPPSVRGIQTHVRHTWLLTETLRGATSGRGS